MRLNTKDGVVENFNSEPSKRGKSWVATVKQDRSAPGGLDRMFWERSPGNFRKVPDGLQVGDVLEFAGDYYTSSGNKHADRRYCRVVEAFDKGIEVTDPVVRFADVLPPDEAQRHPLLAVREELAADIGMLLDDPEVALTLLVDQVKVVSAYVEKIGGR